MLIGIKFLALVIAIWFTSVNIIKCCYKNTVPAMNLAIMAFSIATFIFLQFHLY